MTPEEVIDKGLFFASWRWGDMPAAVTFNKEHRFITVTLRVTEDELTRFATYTIDGESWETPAKEGA